MAELAGYQPALPATIDGGSITAVLRNAGEGEVKRQRPYLIFHQAVDRNAQSALRWGNLKLVKTWKTGKLELFDLSKDLSEANDLSVKMPEKTKEFDRVLTAFITEGVISAVIRCDRAAALLTASVENPASASRLIAFDPCSDSH
eukprot:gene20837-25542_t